MRCELTGKSCAWRESFLSNPQENFLCCPVQELHGPPSVPPKGSEEFPFMSLEFVKKLSREWWFGELDTCLTARFRIVLAFRIAPPARQTRRLALAEP